MSRGEGEEADEPVAGGEHAGPGGPPGPSPHFTVVISGDGSAAIDGEPVTVAEGGAVDAAILDTLHGHARDRGTTVTAAISDPAAGYVAFVEVSPDGSSSLLEQEQEQEASPPPPPPSPSPSPVPPPPPVPSLVKRDALDDADGFDDLDDLDEATYALPEPEGPPPPPPSGGPEAGPGPDSGAGPGPGGGIGAGLGPGGGIGAGWGSGSGPESRPEPPARPVAPPKPARRTAPRQSDDAFEGPGLLGRPLVIGPVALGVAALVVIPLVILGSGGSDGGGSREQAAARTNGSPSAEASPSLETPPRPTPSPSVSVSASPSAESKDKDRDKDKSKDKDKDKPKPKPTPTDTPGAKSGGSVTVTVTATPPKDTTTVTAKPPQDTAASAVRRLARSDPSGRHICYRAYVAGQGWQKPVCDGTMAGTTGQNRPIKALNFAVHGVDGSSANAFRHSSKPVDGRGQWQPSWTAVTGDGKNFYIGSAKRDAPNMLGFAINVGSGEICHTVRLRQRDWGQRTCTKPRPDYTFGGTLDNDVWLEAVKFTV